MSEQALSGSGTPESDWQSWAELRRWPALRLTPAPAVVVAVAPHPDDEVLGIGGLLALLSRAGSLVHLIAVTDGEASHPDSPTVPAADMAIRRIAESDGALETLGLGKASVERLHLPDGGVREAEARLAPITAAVIRSLARLSHHGPAWCLAPWCGDGHPDHQAVGLAAAAGASGTARLLSYPVWMWHWARPRDMRVPWASARRVPLPEDVRAAKLRAVEQFRTQIAPLSEHPADAPILAPEVLQRLTREAEVVFESGPS